MEHPGVSSGAGDLAKALATAPSLRTEANTEGRLERPFQHYYRWHMALPPPGCSWPLSLSWACLGCILVNPLTGMFFFPWSMLAAERKVGCSCPGLQRWIPT